jgi:hypothetical protein
MPGERRTNERASQKLVFRSCVRVHKVRRLSSEGSVVMEEEQAEAERPPAMAPSTPPRAAMLWGRYPDACLRQTS